MSILRKRGKEKLRFRIMNKRVTNKEFKYLKRLFIECLSENPDIAERLDEIYRLIQVYFFYEATDPNAANSLRSVLNDFTIQYLTIAKPAFAQSRKNIGCVMVFVKHLHEFTQGIEDIKDKNRFNQGHFFEELYHLVQQKGDSSVHPSSYWILWALYTSGNLQQYGNDIIFKLDSIRQHYEFNLIMIRAYPADWVVRCWKYFEKYPDYEKAYEYLKENLPMNVAYAALIKDYLGVLSVLYAAERVPKQSILDEHRKLLDEMKQSGNVALELVRSLIRRDMGLDALRIVESIDESIFETSELFFAVILDLWKSLCLV